MFFYLEGLAYSFVIWEGMAPYLFSIWEGMAFAFLFGGAGHLLIFNLGGDSHLLLFLFGRYGHLSISLFGRGWPTICFSLGKGVAMYLFFFFGEIACCQDFQFLLTPRTPSFNIQFLFLIKNTGPPYQNTKNTQPQYSFFLFRVKNTRVAKQPFPVFSNFPPYFLIFLIS